jgi:hypothetical protein
MNFFALQIFTRILSIKIQQKKKEVGGEEASNTLVAMTLSRERVNVRR